MWVLLEVEFFMEKITSVNITICSIETEHPQGQNISKKSNDQKIKQLTRKVFPLLYLDHGSHFVFDTVN